MKAIICTILMLYSTTCFGESEWFPFVEQNTITYPSVQVPLTPSITYTNITVSRNFIRYQWVPIIVNRPMIINHNGLFIKKQQIIYQPTIEWIVQPIYY